MRVTGRGLMVSVGSRVLLGCMSTVSFTRRVGAAALLAAAAVTVSAATASTASATPSTPMDGSVNGAWPQPFYEVWEPGQVRPPHSGGMIVPGPDGQGVSSTGAHAVGPLPDGAPQDIRPVVVPGHEDPR